MVFISNIIAYCLMDAPTRARQEKIHSNTVVQDQTVV